jgi:NitT/TauT family transport system substrate-binding protein
MSKHYVLFVSALLWLGCFGKSPASPGRHFKINIDWLPSAEYYGFFYAKSRNIYRGVGLDVEIVPGSGAPIVAKQLASGDIYAGTTTSDNVLREVARGAAFSRIVPVLCFNPCVIASLKSTRINQLSDLRGKTLGTNQQSSAYQQLMYFIEQGMIKKGSFKEYPIGFGGAEQLKSGVVDAIIAYTTNTVVDLERQGVGVKEIYLGDQGVATYGLVLVLGSPKQMRDEGLSDSDVDHFVKATLQGYAEGLKDVNGAIAALHSVEPTLDEVKLRMAIEKIKNLNNRSKYPASSLDQWVRGTKINDFTRRKVLELYR